MHGLPLPFPCRSSLQQLVISGMPGEIGAASVQAFCQLQGLTALHLPYCGLQSLPDGPYLSSLKRCAAWVSNRLGHLRVAGCAAQRTSLATARAGVQSTRARFVATPCCCSLDISGNPRLASPIPFAATTARGLRALSTDGPDQDWEAADWLDLEGKLHCFKQLEVRPHMAT